MNHDKSTKVRDIVLIVVFTILYAGCQISIPILGRLNLTIFNGVVSAFQYGICLYLMSMRRKGGLRVSIILMCFTILAMAQALFLGHQMSALPGFFNAVFYMITLLLLSNYHKKRERESVTDLQTGILNLRGLYKNLHERMESNAKFSVIYINLDNYKAINDTYGHAFGDELLHKVTKRISVKVGKAGEIARIGGTEFAVVIDGKIDEEDMANKILDTLSEKSVLVVDDNRVECYMTCYAGIATYPEDAKDSESLIKYADIAMAEAMARKSKRACSFDQDMARALNRRIEVENLIKEALRKNYFYLVYQPQYILEGKKLRGFEALLRMRTPDGSMVSPGEFIPVAEKSDLILQIDDYVLNQAALEFRDVVKEHPEITLSINVSAKNICDGDFVGKLRDIINRTGYPAGNLEIEITEYCMVASMDTTIGNIKALRELGVQVALDDFGTGYTSLNYLATLPINLLKIDKSLIDDIEVDTKRREFVHAVVAMGHLMECEVIAEGAENEQQLALLREDGCDLVQGYVWGKPLDYEVAKVLATTESK